MQPLRALLPLLFVLTAVPASADPAAPRTVEITAPDGATLKATYYAASAPGPAVMLLHMCNTDRRSWEPLGPQLSAAGIHALALDYRGYEKAPARDSTPYLRRSGRSWLPTNGRATSTRRWPISCHSPAWIRRGSARPGAVAA